MNAPARNFEETRRVPFAPSYCVSESGKVGRVGTDHFLRPCLLKRGGYLAVSLNEGGKARTWPVHQIVALTFLALRSMYVGRTIGCKEEQIHDRNR